MLPVSPRNSESYLIPSAKSLSVLDSQDGLYCPQQKPQPKDNIILISQLIKACAEMFMNNEVYERGWKDFPKEREKAEMLLSRAPGIHKLKNHILFRWYSKLGCILSQGYDSIRTRGKVAINSSLNIWNDICLTLN